MPGPQRGAPGNDTEKTGGNREVRHPAAGHGGGQEYDRGGRPGLVRRDRGLVREGRRRLGQARRERAPAGPAGHGQDGARQRRDRRPVHGDQGGARRVLGPGDRHHRGGRRDRPDLAGGGPGLDDGRSPPRRGDVTQAARRISQKERRRASSSRSAGLPASASARSLASRASSSRPRPVSSPARSAWNSRYPSRSAASGVISASAASGPTT